METKEALSLKCVLFHKKGETASYANERSVRLFLPALVSRQTGSAPRELTTTDILLNKPKPLCCLGPVIEFPPRDNSGRLLEALAWAPKPFCTRLPSSLFSRHN